MLSSIPSILHRIYNDLEEIYEHIPLKNQRLSKTPVGPKRPLRESTYAIEITAF